MVQIEYNCPKCNKTWKPKNEHKVPISCPRCKIRFDYGKWEGKIKRVKDTLQVKIE